MRNDQTLRLEKLNNNTGYITLHPWTPMGQTRITFLSLKIVKLLFFQRVVVKYNENRLIRPNVWSKRFAYCPIIKSALTMCSTKPVSITQIDR